MPTKIRRAQQHRTSSPPPDHQSIIDLECLSQGAVNARPGRTRAARSTSSKHFEAQLERKTIEAQSNQKSEGDEAEHLGEGLSQHEDVSERERRPKRRSKVFSGGRKHSPENEFALSKVKRARITSTKSKVDETYPNKISETTTAITLPSGEVFIPHKQLDIGHIQYKDETIHSSTMEFLAQLARNNNREWFAEHDPLYRAAKQDFEKLVEKLSKAIVERVDTTIPELPLKDLVFRIYRDIRFSNDQTPYKVYFSAAWSRTGRKGPYAHYYLQIQPNGKSFIGGGIWQANSQQLSLLRRQIDQNPQQLKSILATEAIAVEFLGLKKAAVREAVRAFARRNDEDALKTAPKNFSKDHAEIELLRLRSFTVGKNLSDEEVKSAGLFQQVIRLFEGMEPLISYLNSIVMPDLNTDEEQLM